MKDEKEKQYPSDPQTDPDAYLAANIEAARTDHNKACDLYRSYVGSAETEDERIRRINHFRCGGG